MLVAVVVVLGACSRSSGNVVEAPMISVDASAAAIALVNDTHPSGAAGSNPNLLVRAGHRFDGTYRCAQGATEVSIKLEDVGRGDGEVTIEALFEFHVLPDPGRSPEDGSFRARGTFDPRTRRLHLRGDSWIDQPPGYQLVSFLGTVSKRGDTYAGSVEGHQCTTFATTLHHEDDESEH